ncbi:MAG: hypothetical protein GZ091_13290 [Paludibacter sp.]|nr:hypothetical protein [Paludibacter sp.]
MLITLWLCNKQNVFKKFKKGDGLITFFFILFSLFYAISAFNNNDGLTIIFSQYSRYLIAYCLWFLVRREIQYKNADTEKLNLFIYDVFLMQIVITLAKIFIFRGQHIESIVGSISHTGGAPGTTIPILGFISLWFVKQGVLQKKEWIFVAGLMLIGLFAGKRAIWFIMPIVIAGFMLYVPGLKLDKKMWFVLLMAPFVFYLGVRLTPTLNPENVVWGSFDIDYTFDYAEKYQFGDQSIKNQKKAQGRGGATLALWDKWNSNESLTENDWFGIGFSSMYASDYDSFSKLGLGLNHKGSATGVFQSYVTSGYMGVITTTLFFFSLLWRIKTKRVRWLLIAIVAWEYFLYTGLIFRTPAFMFLIIYFVHYSNYQYKLKKNIKPAPTPYISMFPQAVEDKPQ